MLAISLAITLTYVHCPKPGLYLDYDVDKSDQNLMSNWKYYINISVIFGSDTDVVMATKSKTQLGCYKNREVRDSKIPN